MPTERPAFDPLSHLELRQALAEGRVRTMYQPIVRMSDGTAVGLEALARLVDPVRGTLGPDEFVPTMERVGLGRAVFEAVVRAAFDDWRHGGLADLGLTLAVNLPLDVLMEPVARDWLDAARRANLIPAERIIIELTESQPLLRLPELAGATADLRARGYGLAIDDVGPGVRDHSPLLDLPFTVLKLDRALVQAGREDPECAFFAEVMQAARRAGLVVIAEGVEDEATWAAMAARGVDRVQGYLVSRPLSAADTVAWVHGHAPALS